MSIDSVTPEPQPSTSAHPSVELLYAVSAKRSPSCLYHRLHHPLLCHLTQQMNSYTSCNFNPAAVTIIIASHRHLTLPVVPDTATSCTGSDLEPSIQQLVLLLFTVPFNLHIPNTNVNCLFLHLYQQHTKQPNPVAARSKAQGCSLLITGIASSNPAEDMDVLLLCRQWPLRRADHSYRGDLPGLCEFVCDLETSTLRQPKPELGCCDTRKTQQ